MDAIVEMSVLWYHDNISLEYYRLVGLSQFETTGKINLNIPTLLSRSI